MISFRILIDDRSNYLYPSRTATDPKENVKMNKISDETSTATKIEKYIDEGGKGPIWHNAPLLPKE